jgi:hypothetical protein
VLGVADRDVLMDFVVTREKSTRTEPVCHFVNRVSRPNDAFDAMALSLHFHGLANNQAPRHSSEGG